MELEYLKATQEDAQQIFELCKSLIDTYEDLSSVQYPQVLDWVARKIRQNIAMYTVITRNGQKVGYFSLLNHIDGWELDDFYVLPAYRGNGIGTAVLQNICMSAKGRIFLYVFTQNTGAVSLYERFGFQTSQTVSATRQIMERPG